MPGLEELAACCYGCTGCGEGRPSADAGKSLVGLFITRASSCKHARQHSVGMTCNSAKPDGTQQQSMGMTCNSVLAFSHVMHVCRGLHAYCIVYYHHIDLQHVTACRCGGKAEV